MFANILVISVHTATAEHNLTQALRESGLAPIGVSPELLAVIPTVHQVTAGSHYRDSMEIENNKKLE